MTERIRWQIQAAEISFLRRVAGISLKDKVRSSVAVSALLTSPVDRELCLSAQLSLCHNGEVKRTQNCSRCSDCLANFPLYSPYTREKDAEILELPHFVMVMTHSLLGVDSALVSC